jgi:hypothetical protein
MPKAGTVDREPADVKRAAAAEGIPAEKNSTPVDLAPTAGPIKLDKLPFFEMLARLTEREWEDRIVYLYRQDKNIIKEDPKDSNYIARITHAFDEPYVKDKFGGGRFLAILKNVRINGAERKHSFLIEGSPIIQEGEISIAKKTDAGAGAKSETALLLEQLNKLTEKLLEVGAKNNGAENDTITRSVAMLSEASRGALEIQQQAMKSQIGSSTGHPLVDKFLEASIAKLGNATEAKGDSLEQFTRMLALMKELNKGNEKPASGGLLGNLGEIKGVLEVLKDLGVKIGGGATEAAGEGGMDWKSVLASTLPNALQVVGGYVERWIATQQEQNRIMAIHAENGRRAAAGQPLLPAAPPPPQQVQTFANHPAPAPVATGPQASALPPNFASASQPAQNPPPAPAGEVLPFPGSQANQQPQIEVDLDFVCMLIRRCFDAGDPGDIPALSLKRIFADSLEPMRPYFSDGEQLKQLAGMSPVIAEIIPDPEFPAFLKEFVEEMNRNEDEEPEPAPEGGGAA